MKMYKSEVKILESALAWIKSSEYTYDNDWDGDGTMFGFCPECRCIEYKPHESNCHYGDIVFGLSKMIEKFS